MSDKARKLYPIDIIFTPGELPTPQKLNGLSKQTAAGLSLVASMIGDIWNQAGDPVLSPSGSFTMSALHIPNIGRAIGDINLLNTVFTGSSTLSTSNITFTNALSSFVGTTRFNLWYKPLAGTTYSYSGDSAIIIGQRKTSVDQVITAGDWYVDENKGIVYTYSPITSINAQITYTPANFKGDTQDTAGTDQSSWNVIPDIRGVTYSAAYNGCKISFANGTNNAAGYHIWLPPRKRFQNLFGKMEYLDGDGYNIDSSPEALPLSLFQSTTANASLAYGDHYRYNLPAFLVNSPNSPYPEGFLFLWDEEKGTIVEGVTFTKPGSHSKFKLIANGPELVNVFGTAIGNGIITSDSTQLPADYVARFKLILVGNSLAKMYNSLNARLTLHRHDGSDGLHVISHKDLTDTLTGPYSATKNPNYPSTLPPMTHSRWMNDDHTQYLHRGGSPFSSTEKRDKWNNGMLESFSVCSPSTQNKTYWSGVLPELRINMSSDPDGLLTSSLMAWCPGDIHDFEVGNYNNVAGHKAFAKFTNSYIHLNTLRSGVAVQGEGTVCARNFTALTANADTTAYYFSTGSTPTINTPNNYLALDQSDNEYQFFRTGSIGNSSVRAGTVKTQTIFTYANPFNPDGKEQTWSISHLDMVGETTHGSFNFKSLFNGTGSPAVFYAAIHLPNYARISAANSNFVIKTAGNGVTGVEYTVCYINKNTDILTILSNATCSSSASDSTYTGTFLTDKIVDNASEQYVLVISMPAFISAPKFYWANIRYYVSAVEN